MNKSTQKIGKWPKAAKENSKNTQKPQENSEMAN
jgi:hypothetical protein